MKNKNNPLSIVLMLLLIVALVAGMFLVNQNQETRRGAYFAGTKVMLLPAATSAKVGENVPVQLWVQTDGAKVSAVDAKICYDNKLKLDAADVSTLINLNQDAFKVVEYAKAENNCLRLVVVSSGISPENLKSGLVRVANVRFKAMAVGSGKFTLNIADVKVSGYNPAAGATDTTMKISSVTGADYVIGTNVGVCTWCGSGCIKRPVGMLCADVVPPLGKNCITTPSGACSIVDALTPTPTPTGSFPAPILKFKMSFYGITPAAACADAADMPLTVTVRANDGTTKTYENVVPVKETSSGSLAIYDVTLPLTGFTHKDGLAVFVKSKKSLQVKYGVNNQDSYYGKAGGELSGVSTNDSNTAVFNFEKYPLLAGDVTGPTDSVQDGVVDGLDFSFVKTQSIKRTEVPSGDFMLSDLNGNCKMESQDLSNLMLSLSVKQGQLY